MLKTLSKINRLTPSDVLFKSKLIIL